MKPAAALETPSHSKGKETGKVKRKSLLPALQGPQQDQPFPGSSVRLGRGILCPSIISRTKCALPILGVSMVLNFINATHLILTATHLILTAAP